MAEVGSGHVGVLLVEKGDPYKGGELVSLVGGRFTIGRTHGAQRPDLAFSGLGISRAHARIDRGAPGWEITDLASNNGTLVNGERLRPGVARPLRDGDRIELGRRDVVLVLLLQTAPGDTITYPRGEVSGLALHEGRRAVLVDGQVVALAGKLYELFRLLWAGRGQAAVSHETIKREVWYDRQPLVTGQADVSDEEVATLVHRLRGQLGPYGDCLRAIRGYGYLLNWRE